MLALKRCFKYRGYLLPLSISLQISEMGKSWTALSYIAGDQDTKLDLI